MPIRPSAGSDIRHLVQALDSTDDVARESAQARLLVIGPRAIAPLLQEFPAASPRARAGILRAFEAAADPRTLPASRAALQDSARIVYVAAIGAVRALLTADRPEVARDALDALVAMAVDSTRDGEARLAAAEALRDVPGDVRAAVGARLAADPDPGVRGGVTPAAATPDPGWQDAVAGRLPASPAALKTMLSARRTTARLTELQQLVDRVRTREHQEADVTQREEWRAVRGAVHQALAARNSRLALYDLRDSLLGSERMPVTFLAALEEIGDATCLEPLAAAYDASSRSSDVWWREHVAAAFRAIVQREGLTRRHAAVKRAMARWPDAAADLMGRV